MRDYNMRNYNKEDGLYTETIRVRFYHHGSYENFMQKSNIFIRYGRHIVIKSKVYNIFVGTHATSTYVQYQTVILLSIHGKINNRPMLFCP